MSESKRAIRLLNVSCIGHQRSDKGRDAVSVEQVREAAQNLVDIWGFAPNLLPIAVARGIRGEQTVTIRFPDRVMPEAVKQRMTDLEAADLTWEKADSDFLNLTVLRSPPSSTLDVCAIHGLNGNAFDTWCAENGSMWLHDLLPTIRGFDTARIMTFGYTSGLRDKKKKHDLLSDYSDQLLSELGQLRAAEDASRPLVFICHSMGGLVARRAMTLVHSHSKVRYRQFDLGSIGIIFFSTPHFGSGLADWTKYLASLDKILGVREPIVDALRTFNPSAVDDIRLWREMESQPVIHCFCEAEETSFKKKNRFIRWAMPSDLIVTPASAGFPGYAAEKLLGTNHHTVCRFAHKQGAFRRVEAGLLGVEAQLMKRARTKRYLARKPESYPLGRPRPLPPSCPPARGQKYYVGGELRFREGIPFVGRSDLLLKAQKLLDQPGEPRRWISLVGMGGIGKTEISYQISREYRDKIHIFFLKASDSAMLQQAYQDVAGEIGHEVLVKGESLVDAQDQWFKMTLEGRMQRFKQWVSELGDGCLVVLDDLDDAGTATMLGAVPRVIFSTRNLELATSQLLSQHYIPVPEMSSEDVKELLLSGSKSENIDLTEEDLSCLAAIAGGHPLTLSRIYKHAESLGFEKDQGDVRSDVQLFIHLFDAQNQDCDRRKHLLTRQPPLRDSIMESFSRFFSRMKPEVARAAKPFFEMIAFTSPVFGSQTLSRFRDFQVARPWLSQYQDHLKDYAPLASGRSGTGELLQEFVRVSLARKNAGQDSFDIHPVWAECQRQQCTPARRAEWLREIILVCWAWSRQQESNALETAEYFADNAFALATSFNVQDEDLVLGPVTPSVVVQWRSRCRERGRQHLAQG